MTEFVPTNNNTMAPTRSGHQSARKQRIERWASRKQTYFNHGAATAASTLLGTLSAQRRSESTYLQANRMLHVQLLQLSEERQKIIERSTFDQKIFVNRQALRHKNNQAIIDTLSYVRECSKYADTQDDKQNPTNSSTPLKRSHSRSSSSPTRSPPVKRSLSANISTPTNTLPPETSSEQNEKNIQSDDSTPTDPPLIESKTTDDTATPTIPDVTPVNDDTQKRHVQFLVNADDSIHVASKSAHSVDRSRGYSACRHTRRNIISAPILRSSSSSHHVRCSNSAPSLRVVSSIANLTHDQTKQSFKTKRSASPMGTTMNSVHEFRLHPERFLSASNCYLPLLRRQAIETDSKEICLKQQKEKIDAMKKQGINISVPLPAESDVAFDDAKSFLSEDNDIGKYTARSQTSSSIEQDRKYNRKRPTSKIDLMETDATTPTSHTLAIARFREREFARLHDLIQSDLIEKIIEPLSLVKTDESEQTDSKQEKASNHKRPLITTTTDQSSLKPPARARQLADILRSIDSLTCAETMEKRARRDVNIEKNRAKLGILIF